VALLASPVHAAAPAPYQWKQMTLVTSTGVGGTYDLIARLVARATRKEVALGGDGVGSSLIIFPSAMNKVLGTKFKIVMGYRSSQEVFLAIQRGEVQARMAQLTAGAIVMRDRGGKEIRFERGLTVVGCCRSLGGSACGAVC
jgi:tripartite-type tricarboxylate transporter receptor subunit TctC